MCRGHQERYMSTCSMKVDSATGQLFPLYDEGTNVVLLSGRGDNTIHVYELGAGCSQITPCSDMMVAGEPMCAIAALPKQSVDVMAVETSKILRYVRWQGRTDRYTTVVA